MLSTRTTGCRAKPHVRDLPAPTFRHPRPCHTLAVKVRDVLSLITADGWYLIATVGSHQQYKHPTKPGRVTIAGHPGDDMKTGTLNSVLKQAGLKGSARN